MCEVCMASEEDSKKTQIEFEKRENELKEKQKVDLQKLIDKLIVIKETDEKIDEETLDNMLEKSGLTPKYSCSMYNEKCRELELYRERCNNSEDSDDSDKEMTDMVITDVKSLIRTLLKQGHSGFSVHFVMNMFKKLIDGQLLSPFIDKDEFWINRGEGRWQYKRRSSIFSDDDRKTFYDIEGYIFVSKNGSAFSTRQSRKPIKEGDFPTRIYINEGTPEAEPFKKVFEDLDDE